MHRAIARHNALVPSPMDRERACRSNLNLVPACACFWRALACSLSDSNGDGVQGGRRHIDRGTRKGDPRVRRRKRALCPVSWLLGNAGWASRAAGWAARGEGREGAGRQRGARRDTAVMQVLMPGGRGRGSGCGGQCGLLTV